MTTPLHCKVCAKPLHGQQRLYCGRPCKRRAYAAKQKLREAQELADVVDKVSVSTTMYDKGSASVVAFPTGAKIEHIVNLDPVSQPSLPHRLCAYIQLLGHTLYHVFDGWRTK
jgi:hypothetical protein